MTDPVQALRNELHAHMEDENNWEQTLESLHSTVREVKETTRDNAEAIGKIDKRMEQGDKRLDLQAQTAINLDKRLTNEVIGPLGPVIQLSSDLSGFVRISTLIAKFVILPGAILTATAGGLHMVGIIDLIGLFL